MQADVGIDELHRLLRIHVDLLMNGPRPYSKKNDLLHLMKKEKLGS